MKKNFLFLMFALIGGLLITSCNDDDDGAPIIENPVYGFQVMGTATGGEALVIATPQIVEPSSDFSVKEVRSGMNYGIFYLAAGEMTFKNVDVDGETTYSVSGVATRTQEAEAGAAFMYEQGTLTEGGTDAFTVATAGLYYVMTDEDSGLLVVMKIDNFEINATGDLATYVSGDATGATFKATGVGLNSVFKVRMNTAWKFVIVDDAAAETVLPYGGEYPEDFARPVISFGGSLDNLDPKGADIEIDNGGKLLDFTFAWNPDELGMASITATTEEGGDFVPEFPDQMFMIGASIGGWTWGENDIEMIPVHSNPHLFWSIVWVEQGVADAGFKFSPEQDWGKDFGVEGDAVDGVYQKGTGNVPDVHPTGYYMVVVNLKDETIEVNAPSVNGINPVFGDDDWAGGIEFTVDNDNSVITSPAFTADGDLRMYVKAATLLQEDGTTPTDWWQSEFNVYSGAIEYRGTGNDQAANPVNAGQTVSLNFKEGTGVIQ